MRQLAVVLVKFVRPLKPVLPSHRDELAPAHRTDVCAPLSLLWSSSCRR